MVRGPLGISDSLSGFHEVETIFLIILRCHLLFSLLLSHECTVEFSGGHLMCGDDIVLMTNECVLCILGLRKLSFNF